MKAQSILNEIFPWKKKTTKSPGHHKTTAYKWWNYEKGNFFLEQSGLQKKVLRKTTL